jgi:hypothetical protein
MSFVLAITQSFSSRNHEMTYSSSYTEIPLLCLSPEEDTVGIVSDSTSSKRNIILTPFNPRSNEDNIFINSASS